jgi:hypothetical protein
MRATFRERALGRFQVVLSEIGNELADRLVQRDAALIDEPQDRRRGEDDLRQRGEIEHRLAPHGNFRRLQLRVSAKQDGAAAACIDDTQHRAGNAPIRNRPTNRIESTFGDGGRRHERLQAAWPRASAAAWRIAEMLAL